MPDAQRSDLAMYLDRSVTGGGTTITFGLWERTTLFSFLHVRTTLVRILIPYCEAKERQPVAALIY